MDNINLIPFRGSKISLRPMKKSDIEVWYDLSKDEGMQEWVGNKTTDTLEEIDYLLNVVYPKHMMVWMIVENETANVIGMFRLSFPIRDKDKMIMGESQRLHSKYHRNGYMKEVKSLMYPYIFDVLKVDELYADVWIGNEDSHKSLLYYGYKLVESKEEYFEKYDRLQRKLYLKLTKEWWLESESYK